MIESDKPFLTSAELARALGVSVRSLQRYVKAGRVRPTRLSQRCVRFSADEVRRIARPRPVRRTTEGA